MIGFACGASVFPEFGADFFGLEETSKVGLDVAGNGIEDEGVGALLGDGNLIASAWLSTKRDIGGGLSSGKSVVSAASEQRAMIWSGLQSMSVMPRKGELVDIPEGLPWVRIRLGLVQRGQSAFEHCTNLGILDRLDRSFPGGASGLGCPC